MGATPDEIRNEIERTRTDLGEDVDRIVDRTSPRRILRRRAGRTRQAVRTARERIMGVPAEGGRQARTVGHGIADTAHSAAEAGRRGGRQTAETARRGTEQVVETAKHGAQQVADAVSSAPDQAKERTQGNPLGAGIVAFGAGLVAASLLPSSPAERMAGRHVREHADDVMEPVKQVAAEPAQRLAAETRDTAREAAQEVGDAATRAAQTTGRQTREKGQDLAGDLGESAQNVRDQARGDDSR